MDETLSSLSRFVNEVPASEKTLLVVNRTGLEPLIDILDGAFSDQSVTIAERHIPEGTDDIVCLVDEGEVIATSPFGRVQRSFLLVNADRYRTGARPVGPDAFPDVLTGMAGTEFAVAGFPVSNKQKLLLVLISRYIERLALATGDGRLDSTFQRLSRLDDEHGTRKMYEWLGDSDVGTHVYGIQDDPDATAGIDVQVHSNDTEAYRRSWVVVFSPGDGAPRVETEPTHAALVAIEVGPNVWRGVWTYEDTRVERIQSYIKQRF